MKQHAFGESRHISEEELKQFDEEYGKCKDNIVRTLSTIKTDIIQESLQGLINDLPNLPLQNQISPEAENNEINSDNEIPEEICKDEDELDEQEIADKPIELEKVPEIVPISPGMTELTSFLTPTNPSVSSSENLNPKPTTPLHLAAGLSPEKMLVIKKAEQLEQLKRSTLNTALYKSRKINPENKPPVQPRKEKLPDDSICDPNDDSLDENSPEEKKSETASPEPIDPKTQSIIKVLDSTLIKMQGNNAILEETKKIGLDNKEKNIIQETIPVQIPALPIKTEETNTIKKDQNVKEEKKSPLESAILTESIEIPDRESAVFERSENDTLSAQRQALVHTANELEKDVKVDTTNIEIIKFLGSGSEGKVYLGKITSLNEYVALKQFELNIDQKEAKKLFDLIAKEVELVKNLNHQNIVKYYKLHRSNFRQLQNVVEYNVIMEYMDEGSLADILKNHKRGIAKPQIQEIMRQVLSGLQYLHSHNIIHRDLKPANILVSKNGNQYKITDFGISTQVKEKMTNVRRTVAGTPWYMAPEVILGKPYSYAADIWSLGCLCFELFCGKRPYHSYEWMQAMFQMVQHISPIETCSPTLKYQFELPENAKLLDFLQQCWRHNPIDRPKASKLLLHPFVRKRTVVKKNGKKGKKPAAKGKKKDAAKMVCKNKV